MRLRSREQAVPSPLRKRTRSAINSRSSSRSSSVSQISNTSSRSKRARIVSPDRSECKVAKRKVAKARITRSKQGTSSPLVKTPSKRGRPLKRPRSSHQSFVQPLHHHRRTRLRLLQLQSNNKEHLQKEL